MIRPLVTCCALLIVLSNNAFGQLAPSPGPEHKILQDDVGTWEATMKLWMAPNTDPVEATGVEENKSINGGFWVVQNYSANILGQAMTGHGMTGYDPQTKKFVGVWTDSMSPHMMKMEGTYNADTKTMEMTYKGFDTLTNRAIEGKATTRWIDQDTRLMEMWAPAPGSNEMFKSMEISYKRKK
jgi:hypothetical protein